MNQAYRALLRLCSTLRIFSAFRAQEHLECCARSSLQGRVPNIIPVFWRPIAGELELGGKQKLVAKGEEGVLLLSDFLVSGKRYYRPLCTHARAKVCPLFATPTAMLCAQSASTSCIERVKTRTKNKKVLPAHARNFKDSAGLFGVVPNR